jgi:hypothetical protein
MLNLQLLTLVDYEFRALIRNTFERFIEVYFTKKDNKYLEPLLKVSIRLISSLLAIQIFSIIKDNVEIRKYTSYILVIIFIYFVYDEFKN